MRKAWGQYFMEQSDLVKSRATCTRLHVGCVLVRDNRVIASGYNGSISGHEHCDDIGCLEVNENGKKSCKRTIHAEMNALLQCAKYGIPTNGATIFVSHFPCPDCMKSLNQAGIKKVVYKHFYPHRYHNSFHQGMELIQYEEVEKEN